MNKLFSIIYIFVKENIKKNLRQQSGEYVCAIVWVLVLILFY